GQPLFADVDRHLRERGFSFHCFMSVSGRTYKPLVNPRGPAETIRQLLWGEAVYTRDFMRLKELQPPMLLKLAAILHEAYASCDLAALCLQYHDAATGGRLWPYYMQRL